MVLLHPATGTGSISDTPTGPCYPATDVCVTIGHVIAGCAMVPQAMASALVFGLP